MFSALKFTLVLLGLFQLFTLEGFAQNEKSYANRIGMNLLGLSADKLVFSYEHSLAKNGFWLGLEHRLNQLSEEKDQQVNSFALEYRYYFLSGETPANGFFAGIYSKYRWGKENTTTSPMISHQYQALFSGLNTGYRYNLKRLALSAFIGYGWAFWSNEATTPPGATHELNPNHLKDFRLGLNLGLAF